MAAPPNELFIVLSGFGFFFCAIPFWWHLQGTYYVYMLKCRVLLTRASVECWYLPVHVLDGCGVLELYDQRHRLESQRR